MKFTISKKIIEDTIDFLAIYVDNLDSFIPFRGVLIELNYDKLIFTAGNTNIAAQKILLVDEKNIKIEKTGKLLVNILILKNLIKKFEKNITFIKTNNNLEVFENKTFYTLAILEDGRYSDFDFSLTENKYQIESRELSTAINNVYISSNINQERVSTITSNPITKVINIQSENKNLRLTASDSFRLSTHLLKLGKTTSFNLNVDSKNFKKLYHKEMPTNITLFISDKKIGINYNNTTIFTHLVNLKYHNIQNLISFSNTKNIKIKKEEILKLINKTVFYNAEKIKRLEFSISKEEIKASFEVPEVGISQYITTNFEYKGKPFDIDIDWHYIKDALNAFDDEFINLCITNDEKRVYIFGGNTTDNIQLITPIRRY